MNEASLAFLVHQLEVSKSFNLFNYPTTSRIHSLNSFYNHSGEPCFVKREDELGFGISGFKFRKYQKLMPSLVQKNIKEAIVIGSAFSNHVLAVTQLLIENSINPTLLLKGSSAPLLQGNFLYLSMLVQPFSIHWIAKKDWQRVKNLAHDIAQTRPFSAIIYEGATFFECFIGALSLAIDIIRNEQELGFEFDHVFIDAGTGYSAAALLLAFAFIEKKTLCHVLLLADTADQFGCTLLNLHQLFEKWLKASCLLPENYKVLTPSISSSFGSTNQAVFNFIHQTAQAEGFFLDPIYSAKLFYETKSYLQNNKINGKVLLIHSGGALSLTGFEREIQKSFKAH